MLFLLFLIGTSHAVTAVCDVATDASTAAHADCTSCTTTAADAPCDECTTDTHFLNTDTPVGCSACTGDAATCGAAGIVVSCNEGFYLTPLDNTVVSAPVAAKCTALSTGGKTGADTTGALESCMDGYYFTAASTDATTSVVTPATCLALSTGGKTGDAAGLLESCMDGFYFTVAAAPALATCTACTGNAATCSDATTAVTCNASFKKKSDNTCETCGAGVATCDAAGLVLTCSTGYTFAAKVEPVVADATATPPVEKVDEVAAKCDKDAASSVAALAFTLLTGAAMLL